MPTILGANQLDTSYEIENSARFDNTGGDALGGTFGTPTNAKKFTLSMWYKLCSGTTSGGQVLFGENKVQEAKNKWSDVIRVNKNIKLHMVGGLQSNKIKDALSIFSCIHSVDRIKILEYISKNLKEDSLLKEFFIQVNISNEASKGGVDLQGLESFLKQAKTFTDIKILGLMTMPPVTEEPSVYFALLNKLAEKENLKCLSMGMSNDYETAIALGATHIRVGEAIMGPRPKS